MKDNRRKQTRRPAFTVSASLALALALLIAFFITSLACLPVSAKAGTHAAVCIGGSACGGSDNGGIDNTDSHTDGFDTDAACEQVRLASKVLRLHIPANSDSDADQTVKLAVRDAVLALAPALFRDCVTRDDAARAAESNAYLLRTTAESVLADAGFSYGAAVSVGYEIYPERVYGDDVYPAGKYLSLCITLGEGRGHNWWCVLFPSLCSAAAVSVSADTDTGTSTGNAAAPETGKSAAPTSATTNPADTDSIEVGFTPRQYRTVTGSTTTHFRVRFRLLEFFVRLFGG